MLLSSRCACIQPLFAAAAAAVAVGRRVPRVTYMGRRSRFTMISSTTRLAEGGLEVKGASVTAVDMCRRTSRTNAEERSRLDRRRMASGQGWTKQTVTRR
ncbi:hypothetical protein C8Q80DRAFT_1143913 [Daedaleopsis nitida]|nr:hypothetical protein C8Q80DRAFT_1143913 [Daedaleopsis nitida]